ncbi:N-acetyl-gamma-glutamyl-phosphate reductase [bacterium]|nr:N-acetyl-gamma-glutamyl-phosphate reductase [bacterium]
MHGIDAILLGAAGMGAGELLRYRSMHPHLRISQLVSRSAAGRDPGDLHPHLLGSGLPQMQVELVLPNSGPGDPLVLFSAMGHGELAAFYPQIRDELLAIGQQRRVLVIDLSADFRLESEREWEKYYGNPHPCPQFLDEFIYGLPECNREQLTNAQRIASPGCFATAINLCLLPLAGRISGRHIAVCGMTGSSGSGNRPAEGTHHPFRAHDFRAYNMLRHRHAAEIGMLLEQHGNQEVRLSFVPHSAPLVRGIFATLILDCRDPAEAREFAALYPVHYESEGFVHVMEGSPRLASVLGSNQARLCAVAEGCSLAVMCAIDNLGKGMAGQAIQAMNIALGLDENCGLQAAPVYP